MWETPPLKQLEESLVCDDDDSDPRSIPIGMRMRAAYYLRQEYTEIEKNYCDEEECNEELKLQKQQHVLDVLCKGLLDVRHGSLMRHEIAYVMGQIKNEYSCSTLEYVLANNNDCIMVRHEAAEALAAIGARRSIPVLQQVIDDKTLDVPELTETCRVALDVMEWRFLNGDGDGKDENNITEMPVACACMTSPYSSIDPAPPHPSHASMTCTEIGTILRNTDLSIFERYRAMFSLRNIGGADAVQELCHVLTTDTSSTLLRHEIAYVLGQLQHPTSITALEKTLRNTTEHTMVRHESAEALGAIDDKWDEVECILKEFSTDTNDVVRESCLVALDAADYWGYNSSNNNKTDDDNETTNEGAETEESNLLLSFAHQKAGETQKQILLNHFNVQQ